MSLVALELYQFCSWFGDYHWKWPKMSPKNTYILIFSRNQINERALFNNVKHQVNVLLDEDDCYNTVHPGSSSNRIVVFELPTKMGPPKPRKKRNENK